MEYKDYYKILGVAKNASEKEIKAAYRKLARKHHPDLNQNNKQAEARFKEINEAQQVLSDPEKRRRYDRLGADWDKVRPGVGVGGRQGGFHVHSEGFDVGGAGGFSDFFRTFFGGDVGGFEETFTRARTRRAAPVEAEQDVELQLDEVLHGASRELSISEGAHSRRVEVKIPAGVREGSRVRVAGEGGGGGDLYLRVKIAPHPLFERRGDDLASRVKAPLTTVVLGGEVQVPTLEGLVGIKIPAGSPAERAFRLRGKGLPRQGKRGERGDLLASVEPLVPTELSPREQELFEELKRLGR
jgi:DnaJ-class molecular chaperone